jgi:hypothetical protein
MNSRSAFCWGIYSASIAEVIGTSIDAMVGANRLFVPYSIAAAMLVMAGRQLAREHGDRSRRRRTLRGRASPSPQPGG